MSLVELRVEVPAYSRSFQVQVQAHWSIRDIKEEIKRACLGGPQVDGQRVIWRGRILRDEERVSDIWKTPSDPRIIHLAVHPSAWTSSPSDTAQPTPTLSGISQVSPVPQTTAAPSTSSRTQQPSSRSVSLPFIVQKHNAALHVLTHGQLPSPPADPAAAREARSYAAGALYAHGWSWPAVLDEEYPLATGSAGGVKYERTIVDNQPFLRLSTPHATPTPIQQHALKVLSHTFPLLSITTRDLAAHQSLLHNSPFAVTPTANLNQYLQQVGIPPMRLAPDQPNANPNDPNNVVVAEIRVPLRALLMPLIMLTFRTFLLLYFFSPSKRPFFGVVLSLWILWETWGALRRVIGGNRPPAAPGQARGDAAAPGAAEQAANPQAQAAAPPGENHGQLDFLINFFANMGLASEDAILDSRVPAREPSPLTKAGRFVALMLTTLHPAVWDRRRTALRRREGRLRTEANVRESQPPADGEEDTGRAQARTQAVAKHERRQSWVKQYIERVETTEWSEDM